MKNELFNRMIESNKKFWSKINKKNDTDAYLLYEMFYPEPAMVYGIAKTALTIATIKELKPICITGLRDNKQKKDLINSMNDSVLGDKFNFLKSSIKNSFSILKYLYIIKTKNDLLQLKIDKYTIGPYIYDSILKASFLAEINKITFSIKKGILLELCYFYFFKDLLNKYNIKTIVLADKVYRTGLIFELAKHNKIECISPINLNDFYVSKFINAIDYEFSTRTPENKTLNQLNKTKVNKIIEEYFSKRFSAKIEQHDVLRAFSNNKKIYSKIEIIKMHNLNISLPIVVIMSHIFCDAPHSYKGTLYDDYKEWLVNTIISLKKNKKVNFLVKEHPSADLYNEKGVINKILNELDCEHLLLKDDVHSLTILNEFDVVITCGGTIGQEFVYKGKPVVLGAKPPYSGFGFTTEPNTKDEYEALLKSGVEKLPLLNNKQKEMINKVIYHDFVMLDNYSDDLEIGGQRFYMGRDFDYDTFYENILEYNDIPLKQQKIYQLLERFINSNNKHLLKDINE